MLRHTSKWLRAVMVTMVTAGVVPLASAANAVPADAKSGIEATLDKTNELLAKGASAKEVADVMYEDDLTIIGEGEKALYPNLKSFMKPLEGYLTNPTCRLKVVDTIRHSGSLAVAWVQEHCDAHGSEAAEDYRIMYVFRKSAKGWRVTMEMFGAGKF